MIIVIAMLSRSFGEGVDSVIFCFLLVISLMKAVTFLFAVSVSDLLALCLCKSDIQLLLSRVIMSYLYLYLFYELNVANIDSIDP